MLEKHEKEINRVHGILLERVQIAGQLRVDEQLPGAKGRRVRFVLIERSESLVNVWHKNIHLVNHVNVVPFLQLGQVTDQERSFHPFGHRWPAQFIGGVCRKQNRWQPRNENGLRLPASIHALCVGDSGALGILPRRHDRYQSAYGVEVELERVLAQPLITNCLLKLSLGQAVRVACLVGKSQLVATTHPPLPTGDEHGDAETADPPAPVERQDEVRRPEDENERHK